MHTTNTTPRVYVSTYARYAGGSLAGGWIELEGHDADTFREACLSLLSATSGRSEIDPAPEIMFQDFEGFPRSLYGESGLSPVIWDWLECSDEEREVWEAYAEAIGCPLAETTLAQAQEAFVGRFDSVEEFAEQTCEECDQIGSIPDFIRNCIDWLAVWDSALRFDYAENDGFFFRNH